MISRHRIKIFIIGAFIALGAFALTLTSPQSFVQGTTGTVAEVRHILLGVLMKLFIVELILFFVMLLGMKNIVFKIIATILVLTMVGVCIFNPMLINEVEVRLLVRTIMLIGQFLCGIAALSLWLPEAGEPRKWRKRKEKGTHEVSS